jgi:hypothetical protein
MDFLQMYLNSLRLPPGTYRKTIPRVIIWSIRRSPFMAQLKASAQSQARVDDESVDL